MSNLYEDLQLAGANARAMGLSQLDNPYSKAENLPAVSGLSIEEVNSRYDAWDTGWTMENLMRPSSFDVLMAQLGRL